MSHLWRARCAFLLTFAGIIWSHHPACQAQSRPVMSMVSGTVSDPSGAKIPHAALVLSGQDFHQQIATDSAGHFFVYLPPGSYTLSAEAPGFSANTTEIIVSNSGTPVRVAVDLRIAVRQEDIFVPVDTGTTTAADDNASALVFRGVDLDAFSNDDATFQKELLALAGGDGKAPNIFVDGYSGGRIPPKSAIASVRINRNLFSAAYDTFGQGRVEISTKPGGESLHGQINVNATDKALNAQNPYLTTEPPYYMLNLDGNLSGSFDKNTAFFVSGVFNNQQNNAALNALATANQVSPYITAVPDPLVTNTYSLRIDRQVTATNNFTGRYEFNQINLTNGGLTPLLTVATQAFNSGITSQMLQLADTQVFGPDIVYDSRFQYIRTRLQQDAISSAPAVVVQGAFNDGGNSSQSQRDNQDHFEFQQALSIDRGVHYLRFGARYRLFREANLSTANYNGQFTFPSLAAYVAKQPSQFSLTQGKASANVLTGDLGAYAEDEWKPAKSVTLDLGLRIESQSAIPDHLDIAPRAGGAWALHRNKQKAVFLTLRGGGGIFYDRFAGADILTSIRQNGISQQTFYVSNPGFYCTSLAACQSSPAYNPSATSPTIYRLSPSLKSEYGWYGNFSVERLISRYGRIAISYNTIRGVHQYDSQNVNAPLPGTYNPLVPGSGIRPFGGTQNIYEFDSNGIEKRQGFGINSRFVLNRVVGFVSYNYNHQFQNVGVTASTFVSNSYNLAQDYGRAPVPTQQLFVGGTVQLFFGISSSIFANTQGGVPFNIVTGTDLNGDSIYNDRPAFATNTTANSQVYRTRFGTFDANPQPGEKIIPINYGNSPNFLYVDLSASRTFKVGPRPASKLVGGKAGARPDPPYALTFTVDSPGIFNRRNPGQPVGVLTSPLFGQSVSQNNPITANTAANRVIFVQTSFSF
jgi:hypothetical protein